ncbi:MAG: YfaZ family outer membrane protein [Campylobacterota bacterium]
MLKKITLIALCAASAFAMHSGEININNKDLEIGAKFDIGQFNTAVEPDTMFVGGKFINADKDHSSPKGDVDPYFELNFLMMQAVGDQGMSVGMGAKLNFTKNYSAVPLGLEFAYKLPVTDFIPMYLNGSLYYAPSVLCMSDADSFLEYRLSYDVEVIKNGLITIGYRNIDTNYDNSHGRVDFTYNESFYVGFKIGF